MSNTRACLPCSNPMVAQYMRDRFALGAPLEAVSAELAQRGRMAEMGYTRAPGPTMLRTHVTKHTPTHAVVSATLPSFASHSTPMAGSPTAPRTHTDVATAIQQAALEQLERGEMKLTASHALRSQEILDRRAENQKDREMRVVMARLLHRHRTPPESLHGGDDILVIEGVATAVTVE